jgi:hypothetical protein
MLKNKSHRMLVYFLVASSFQQISAETEWAAFWRNVGDAHSAFFGTTKNHTPSAEKQARNQSQPIPADALSWEEVQREVREKLCRAFGDNIDWRGYENTILKSIANDSQSYYNHSYYKAGHVNQKIGSGIVQCSKDFTKDYILRALADQRREVNQHTIAAAIAESTAENVRVDVEHGNINNVARWISRPTLNKAIKYKLNELRQAEQERNNNKATSDAGATFGADQALENPERAAEIKSHADGSNAAASAGQHSQTLYSSNNPGSAATARL